MGRAEICENLASIFCEYKSIRFIRVRNVKLSTIYWLAMFAVLCYVVIFTIFLEKGYQTQDSVIGFTSAKLKGSASIGDPNLLPFNQLIPLDAMDLVLSNSHLYSIICTDFSIHKQIQMISSLNISK